MASGNVEILVHVTAASREADDTRYRSLASSYLGFEPIRQKPWPKLSSPIQQQVSACCVSTADDLEASFSSVIDNVNSPRLRHQSDKPLNGHSSSRHELQIPSSPGSVVEDSLAENNVAFAAFTSPTRLLEHYLQGADHSQRSSLTDTQRNVDDVIRGTPLPPACHAYASKIIAPSDPFPTVPCTPTVDIGAGEPGSGAIKSTTAAAPSDDQVIEETTFISSSEGLTVQGRAQSEPVTGALQKQQRQFGELPSVDSHLLGPIRTTSDLGPLSNSQSSSFPVSSSGSSTIRRPPTVAFLHSHGYSYESLELRSPEPPVAAMSIEPQDLVTPNLAKLAADLDVARRFRPEKVTRSLRPTERGYWLLDCSAWNVQLRRDAWAFLANYIGSDVAGWGVWCRRDESFSSLKIYCWGAIVSHIYLVLYLASQRQILFTGANWVDGDGKTVVHMGGRTGV